MNEHQSNSPKSFETGIWPAFVIEKIIDLNIHLDAFKRSGKSIGFVPTMGALHEGHLTLVEKAKNENDIVIVSIYVNPTQFNNAEDLKNYPRTPNKDFELLRSKKADLVFFPANGEVYNIKFQERKLPEPGKIADVMEGFYRPGHFNGMMQVVSRLFDIVKPDRAYFGEKDYQQLSIVRFMVEEIDLKVSIVNCETVREPSGLAMSSRNLKLSEGGRKDAAEIYNALKFVKDNVTDFEPKVLKAKAKEMIEASGKLKAEYVEISDEQTLQPAESWNQFQHVRCFVAVYCENIRLIDNLKLY